MKKSYGLFIFILALLVILLTDCKVIKNVPLELNHYHTTADSVRIHEIDSVRIIVDGDGKQVGGVEKYYYYNNTVSKDTIKIDVPVKYEVPVEYIPEWMWWVVGVASVIILVFLFRIAFKIYRKFVFI